MAKNEGWPERVAAGIAGEIRRHRKRRGWSVRELAAAVEQLGVTIEQPVLSNLELGRRKTVSVPELIVIAKALGVPPISLIYPLHSLREVEVLPERISRTWPAHKWFAGVEAMESRANDGSWHWAVMDFDDHMTGSGPIDQFRTHDDFLAARLDHADDRGPDAVLWRRRQDEVLRRVRRELREHGITPPDLPATLEYLDDQPGAGPDNDGGTP